jgi:oligosaccharyltransferase complex subunit beta
VIDFIDSGRNVFIAASTNVSESIREIAYDLGIDVDDEATSVIDHIHYDASLDAEDDGLHTVVASSQFISAAKILHKAPSAPVLFQGVGHSIAKNPALIYKVLSGMTSTYSANPSSSKKDPQSIGRNTVLVSAIQTRNNARVIFSGSLALFSNQYVPSLPFLFLRSLLCSSVTLLAFISLPFLVFFSSSFSVFLCHFSVSCCFLRFLSSPVDSNGRKYAKSGNEEFVTDLVQWALQGRGKVRTGNFNHSLAAKGSPANPASYRIKDNIQVAVNIEEFDGKNWVPLQAKDVQLEAVMIDPYIRTTLQSDNKGKFSAQFMLPDVYGVFKFVLRFDRLGYGRVELIEKVIVEPFRHDQFERFIPAAFPYYASAFAMMAGFFVFGLYFLYAPMN